MIQSYSTYQENNFRHLKNRFWKRVLNFCPETPRYNKLKLIENLFWFWRNLRSREFFHDDIRTGINNNNMVYNKTQERTDMSKQLKNRSFHPPQDHCDKPIYFINKKRNYQLMQQEVHQSSTNHPSKTSHQNLQAHQDIIIDTADKGGKIVIMNRNEYKEECKKQISDSTFYEQT